ncbi:MAG: hypothetical protein Homavirus45_1, partial [Homavirus sp.]
TETNSWYELEMIINSNFPKFNINLYDNSRNSIFPEINNMTNKHFFNTNKTIVYFIAKSNTTTVNLNNIFLDNISIKKIDRHYIRIKIPHDIIRKTSESSIGKYYMESVFKM